MKALRRSALPTILVLVSLFGSLSVASLPRTAAQPTPARTYVVDPTGSEDGDGSAENPWQTIHHAAAQVRPGDTVLINPGEYEGGITVATDGTAEAPITFRANGEGVVIEGSGDERDAFFIEQADYVVVEGLTIQHATRAGLRVSASNHVTIRDSVFADNTTWGIFTDFSDDLLIEGNEAYGSREEHGIYVSNSGDRPVVRNNRVHHNVASGIQLNADVEVQEGPNPDGIITGAVIEGNVVYQNGETGGAAINLDGVVESVIRNNLLYENTASGITLFQGNGAVCSRDNLVLNNTIVMAEESRWAVLISSTYADSAPPTPCTGNRLINNIIHAASEDRGSISIPAPDLDGFESDYNILVDRFSVDDEESIVALDEWQALGFDTNSRVATPEELFVDAGGDDFMLRPGSPAIDAGVEPPADLPADLAGNTRPIGAGFDIGAYEAGGAAGPIPAAAEAIQPPPAPADVAPGDGEIAVELTARDGSGVSGLAMLRAMDANTVVTIFLQGGNPGQILFIHGGACDGELEPAYLLNKVDASGQSTSTVAATLADLRSGSYAVAVHLGAQDLGAIVACGDLPATAASTALPPVEIVELVAGGTITYAAGERVFRIAAAEGATPEDVSASSAALTSGVDRWLSLSADGEWLLLETTRFDPACADWPCLAVVPADLSAGEALRAGDQLVHAEGVGTIAAGGDLIVYPGTEGPHDRDLLALARTDQGWAGPTVLTADSPYGWHDWPALSMDGSRVVFTCTPDVEAADQTAICEVGTDGSGFRVVLTPEDAPAGFTPGWLHHPSYAPDGAIVFEADWDGEQIWRLPAGAAEPALITEEFGNDNSPCVLPDGRIVSLWLDRPDGSGVHEVKVMNADGSGWFMLLPDLDIADGSHGCGY